MYSRLVFQTRIPLSYSNGMKKYLRGESNPYLMFRKHLFYPLNYRGNKLGNFYSIR